jgi:hypothetical protein
LLPLPRQPAGEFTIFGRPAGTCPSFYLGHQFHGIATSPLEIPVRTFATVAPTEPSREHNFFFCGAADERFAWWLLGTGQPVIKHHRGCTAASAFAA